MGYHGEDSGTHHRPRWGDHSRGELRPRSGRRPEQARREASPSGEGQRRAGDRYRGGGCEWDRVKPEATGSAASGGGNPARWQWYDAAGGGLPGRWRRAEDGGSSQWRVKPEDRSFDWQGRPASRSAGRRPLSEERGDDLPPLDGCYGLGEGGVDPLDPLGLIQPDPSHYIVGAELKYFRTPPPTPGEKEDYLRNRGSAWADRRRRDFTAWVAANPEGRFEGKGDAHALTTWLSFLRGYFQMEDISNTALQGQLAASTFKGRARSWWNAHTHQRPGLLLSFAQLAELVQKELVPAAEAQTAFQSWAQLQYSGKPEQYLKQLDHLAETFPLPQLSMMQMATAPLGKAFAAEVRNAGLYAHPSGKIPYPRLRQIIANRLETLRPPTDQPAPRPFTRPRRRPTPLSSAP